ncbi:MAG: tetratricopeptide repeat protein [Cyanobacteria bacterium P01_A01_bin.114]
MTQSLWYTFLRHRFFRFPLKSGLILRSGLVLLGLLTLTGCPAIFNGQFTDLTPRDSALAEDASGDDRLSAGVLAYDAGDLAEAATQVEAALELGVIDYELDQAHTILGNIYTDLERYEDAIEQHQQALERNDKNYEAWVNLGVTYRLLGNYEEAEKAYQSALALNADYPELYASLGALSIVQGDSIQAISHLEKAASLDGNLDVTFANLALAYAMDNQFEEADTALRRALALGYENGDIISERIEEFKSITP